MGALHVAAQDAEARRAAAFDLGIAIILTRGDRPGAGDDARGLAEEARREVAIAGGEAAIEGAGLGKRDGHALTVDRIEAAEGIADDQKARRKILQRFIVAMTVGREPVAHD